MEKIQYWAGLSYKIYYISKLRGIYCVKIMLWSSKLRAIDNELSDHGLSTIIFREFDIIKLK